MKSLILLTSALLAEARSVLSRDNVLAPPCGATSVTSYKVVEGDTLSHIATIFQSGICDIASYNGIQNPNYIQTGTTLQIPTHCANPDNTSCLKNGNGGTTPVTTRSGTCVNGGPDVHYVVSGDTLSDIATNFGLTLSALEAANPQLGNNFDNIYPGEPVYFPVCHGTACTIVRYTIQSGDIFYDLAQRYGTTVGQIEEANPGVQPTKLFVGEVINLPTNCN